MYTFIDPNSSICIYRRYSPFDTIQIRMLTDPDLPPPQGRGGVLKLIKLLKLTKLIKSPSPRFLPTPPLPQKKNIEPERVNNEGCIG